MFFDDLEKIPEIAEKTGFSIFSVSNQYISFKKSGKKAIKTAEKTVLDFPANTIYVEPDETGKIGIAKIREIEELMQTKQTKKTFIVIKNAETINQAAENAALKILEEPKENYHLVFFSSYLNCFLPTILSRASVYVYREKNPLENPPVVDDEIKSLAKEIITTKPANLAALIDKLTDKKRKNVRQDVLTILDTATELIYKSYFKTNNQNLLKRLPNLIEAYDNIKANGHIKLQLWSHLC